MSSHYGKDALFIIRSGEYRLTSLLAIVAVVVVSYQPSLRVGFLGDDWWFLGKAVSLSFPEYLKFYFDPSVQIFWYRPLYGIWLLGEYILFGSSPEGYHFGQMLLHLGNCLLLLLLVYQLSARWRLAWLASILYAVLPVFGSAIFWIAVQDPLALLFFLAAMSFWIVHLRTGNRWCYGFAFGSFVLALLGKETSFFLPFPLFLLDRWFVKKETTKVGLVQRYAPFLLMLLVYLGIERQVQTNAYFPNRWGYSLGPHIIENGLRYLGLLVLPWGPEQPANYIVLGVVIVILLVLGLKRHGRLVLFLGGMVVLSIAPALAFPSMFFFPRYLYGAAMVSAVLLGLFLQAVSVKWFSALGVRWGLSAVVVALVFVGSMRLSEMANWQVEEGRQFRVPLRDIYQQHPNFPQDSYLYFVEPPYPMILRNLYGMFALRYGSAINVWSNDAELGGFDTNRFAGLRDHKNTFLYYFDTTNRYHEIVVDPLSTSEARPTLPARLQDRIRLEGYEITGTRVKPGQDLALLLYWRPTDPLEKDYTVFLHLVSEKGETVLGEDTQPRGNRSATSGWWPNRLVVDVHILTVPPDLPPGKYHVELGMYYLPTQQRLQVLDDQSRPVTDHIVIDSFEVIQ